MLTPAKRNRLIELFEGASADPATRVVVLAGEGSTLLLGCRPLWRGGRAARLSAAAARMLRTGSQRLIASVLDCEKPVVGELHLAAAAALVPIW